MFDKAWIWLTTDGRFWAVLTVAAVVKAVMSERIGLRGVLAAFGTAFFAGVVLTSPVMHFFELEEVYREAVAVLLALIGESLMRTVIITFNDPEFIKRIVEHRLGGGKDK